MTGFLRSRWSSAVIGVLVALMLGDAMFLLHSRNSARIVVSEDVVDFGVLDPGERAVKTITISNHGHQDLTIQQVFVSCSCSTVSLSNNVVPPNSSASLRVELTAVGAAKRKAVDFIIKSNDPTSPEKTISASFDMKRDTPLFSRQAYFGRIPKEELPQTRRVFYFCAEVEKRELLDGGLAAPELPFLHVNYAALPNKDGIPIDITLPVESPCGEVMADILVGGRLSDAKQHCIEVIASIRGPVVATPSIASITTANEMVSVTVEPRISGEAIELLEWKKVGRYSEEIAIDAPRDGTSAKKTLMIGAFADTVANQGTWLLGTVLVDVQIGGVVEQIAIPVIRRKKALP